MLIANLKPHSAFPVSLRGTEYEFTTSDDGDESGRVVFPPVHARMAIFAQIGEELRVYCPKLSRTVWRGQIERIEETEDGSIVWYAIGFGALQRDARISILRKINNVRRWETVGQGFLSSGTSRPDLWDVEQITSTTTVHTHMATKRAFTINSATRVSVAFLFNHPERYAKAAATDTLSVTVISKSGLATGVEVRTVAQIPQPPDYKLQLGTTVYTVTSSSYIQTGIPIFGWVVNVNAAGTEINPGDTTVRFSVIVNESLPIEADLLTTAFNQRGGCCTILFPQPIYAQLEKSDANLRDIIEKIEPTYSPVRYNRKRFFRDADKPIIDFHDDSPTTWRFRNKKRVSDISKAPDRIHAEYSGHWSEHLTTTSTIHALDSRRTPALANRHASVGKYNSKTDAEAYRNAAITDVENNITPMTIELDNNFYELMTRDGVCIPNWAADVEDYAEIDNYFRRGKIMAKTITRDSTTYDVTFPSDSFVYSIRGR